ncbi:MAG: hypothetical protein HWE08_09015 [Alphaproteobacteria bacterium]|nr:hypothetical protein [Alphaproteobacteria bacterium]
MRYVKFGTATAAFVIAATASLLDTRVALADASFLTDDDYATNELNTGDWSKAEAALMNAGVAAEDEVFTKINLAFVYSSTGRKERAVAIYNEILASKENPYALTVSGQPKRVKTIAKLALARLDEGTQ